MPSSIALVAALADHERLRLYARICAEPEGLAPSRLDRTDRRVHKVLGRLVSVGLVALKGDRYHAVPDVFRDALEAEDAVRVSPGGDRAVEALFSRGRLISIPRAGDLRSKLLGKLSEQFEAGRKYSEGEVREILGKAYDDHASLRRYLVDEGFLERDNRGTYWRTHTTA
jgi:hypothetical protein